MLSCGWSDWNTFTDVVSYLKKNTHSISERNTGKKNFVVVFNLEAGNKTCDEKLDCTKDRMY